ncbi:hypothetical protein BRADI_1g42275v3 [Brachypodium distachyon]|uniref:Uncharacterized protein n=1 Tax=Brachypodium distachyon TaxID=15368 RepID=A0A0Q3NLQ1_BRADI|nr:hypothetical protein BRADI_1g42275v3 [Brachypodium distachyon]
MRFDGKTDRRTHLSMPPWWPRRDCRCRNSSNPGPPKIAGSEHLLHVLLEPSCLLRAPAPPQPSSNPAQLLKSSKQIKKTPQDPARLRSPSQFQSGDLPKSCRPRAQAEAERGARQQMTTKYGEAVNPARRNLAGAGSKRQRRKAMATGHDESRDQGKKIWGLTYTVSSQRRSGKEEKLGDAELYGGRRRSKLSADAGTARG